MALTREEWAEVEALFAEALEQPERQRAAYVESRTPAGGAVRSEVAAMIAAVESTGDFLADPVTVVAGDEEPGSLEPGDRLGPWRVGARIGTGGMGEVYAASRADDAYEADVAVKVLKRGLDTVGVVRRFLRERRVLGQLDHPNVARLLDAGATADGRPYLVMERVKGVPITEHCRGASTRDVIGLALTLCDAVHAAHGRLVVHRDIKPSNVLVTDAGEVKLLDFGIAKVLADGEADETRAAGVLPLTPAFAAPEQLLGEEVTTATDVYALGALLYLLLTGQLPKRHESAAAAAIAARGDEPIVAPSAAARRSEALGTERARQRRARELAGDLDVILLQALHREPERRYRSAAELGDDLRRHLDRRPVRARPDSAGYRARRFLGRHLRSVLAASIVAVALVGGLAVALWQADEARRAARAAEAQRQRAERVKGFVLSLFEEQDPFRRAQAQARPAGQLVKDGLARVDRELGGEPDLQADLLADLGVVQVNVGDLAAAEESFQRALELRRARHGADSVEALRVEGLLARTAVQTGRFPEAQQRLERTLPRLEAALGPEDPEVIALRRSQVRVLVNASRFEEAARVSADVVRAYERTRGHDDAETAMALTVQGMALIQLGRHDEARAVLEDAVGRLTRTRGADHAQLVYPLLQLADATMAQSRHEEAVAVHDRILALGRRHLGESHVLVGRTLAARGESLRRLGRTDEADAALREAERVLAPVHNQELGLALVYRGRLETDRRRHAAAERAFAEAETIYQATIGETALDTWGARAARGAALARLGRAAEGAARQQEALAAVGRLAGAVATPWTVGADGLAATLRLAGRTAEADALDTRVRAASR